MRKPTFIKSVKNAIWGILWILKNERNFQIEIFALLINLVLISILKVEPKDTVLILIVCIMVLSAEIFNTCIEKICDYLKFDYDERIKIIKDLSAGGVFISAFSAVIVGLVVYPKYFIVYFS